MPAYRIYTIGNEGYFSSAPVFVESADDKAAIEKAMQKKNRQALEIWDDIRLVARLPRPEAAEHSQADKFFPSFLIT
jgi:hypothetical protein